MIEKPCCAIAHFGQTISLPVPDKLPTPLTVHRRNGEPCLRFRHTVEAGVCEDDVMCYRPSGQTDGKTLKDGCLSRLLK